MAKIKFVMLDEDTADVEVELAAKFEVCHRCNGEGKHVNPAVDGNGLSQEDFDEDPDFEEGYFAGRYDVRCEECDGERVTLEVDADACKAKGLEKELQAYYDYQREMGSMDAEMDAEMEAERRMGA